ncbi:MAG: hypothetical protein WAT25_19890, partial [Paracoccaceae bacterium]
MTQIATVILTSSPLTQSRLVRTLSAAPEIRLCGQAGELSGAYVLIEQKEPKLVILGSELSRHPDFGGLLAMFRVMAITWMRIASDSQPGEAAAQAPVL